MKEFFRGWRRKAGCITLMMACLFVTGWVRSFTIQDRVEFPRWSRDTIIYGIVSDSQSISWQREKRGLKLSPPSDNWFRFSSRAQRTANTEVFHLFEYVDDQSICGFGRTYQEIDLGFSTHTQTRYVIPYWFFVLSLTLLSANLILRTPTKRVVPK